MDAPFADPPPGPIDLFAGWHADASAHEAVQYAGAACLSTVDADGWPDGRIVMVHAFDADGFTVFTDARSPKALALAAHPRAALTFYWGPLERQVRVQGQVERAADDEADACFAERPRRSRATAWASMQSSTVGAGALAEAMEQWDAAFDGQEVIPRPPHWQAYRLVPHRIEYWQARARRLHDRLRYTRDGALWRRERLAP